MRTTPLISILGAGAVMLGAMALPTGQPGRPPQRAPAGGGGADDMGARLVAGLKSVPGCLGVDAGQFSSGKNAIIAWFEDKEAVKRWYFSRPHLQMMRMARGPGAPEPVDPPLEHVEDGVPVMVIASITFTEKPEIPGMAMPISQIAIELYAPLPGGAFINERLAPETFRVEHMRDYTVAPGDAPE